MYHAKEFILWSSKYNDRSINFNRKPDPKKESYFVNFIKKRMNKTTMREMLDKANNYLKENRNKKNMITQSLRMTVYEAL